MEPFGTDLYPRRGLPPAAEAMTTPCHRLRKALGTLGLIALAAGAVWAAQPLPGQEPPSRKQPSFERDVLPTLRAHCLKCHGDGARKGGLDLRTLASLLRGSSNGPVLVK